MVMWKYSPLQTNRFMLTYDQVSEVDSKEVGIKALNITRCNDAGFQVPDGIVVPIQSFFAYVRGENLETLFQAIEHHFSGNKRVIVRSSALGEDGPVISYAGQYLSLICSNSVTEIKEACEACWSSYFGKNIKTYHKAIRETNLRKGQGMALLIQDLVNASSSGVCFTKDPLNGEKGVFIINAVHGLGEALMAGEVVADHYEFDIERGKTIDHITGKQTLWRSPESPQGLSPLPQHLLGKRVLTANQIEEIARCAQKAGEFFQDHLDIEWAYGGEELFLLQVRPITRVAKKRDFELWTRDNVADVIPDAVTPLTWSVVKDATNNGFRKVIGELGFPYEPADLFRVFDGRVYCNLTAYQKLHELPTEKSKTSLLIIKVGLNYLRLLVSLKNRVAHLQEKFLEGLKDTRGKSRASTIEALREYLSKYMATHILVTFLMDIGLLVTRRLMGKNIATSGTSSAIDNLVIGLNEVESTASREALWELACRIKEDEKLAETIRNSYVESVPDILRGWGRPYGDMWQDFINRHGHSSLREFELYFPRWAEDPSFVITILKNYMIECQDIDFETEKRIREETRREAEKSLLRRAPFAYRPFLRYYNKHIQQCTIWRESIKQKIVKIMAEIRTQATNFAKDKGIKPFEGVFFLTVPEIAEYENNPISPDILEEIGRRRSEWERWQAKEAFREIRVFTNGQTIKIPHLGRSGKKIQGLGLSSGKYSGRAKIIIDPGDAASFQMGDILVTRSTNPSWTPLFVLAGAIVTDMGNYLSHGAIVARELGIPAVGNLLDATARIKDGQTIEVDGHTGTVTLSREG